jgi:CRISPR-associated protein Cas2
MASGKAGFHLLAYDIADPRRLQRVHRTVREYGLAVQYSVFVVYADSATLNTLCGELATIIQPKEDDIRIYPLPQRLEMHRFGRQTLPIGVEIIGGAFTGQAIAGLVQSSDKT